VNGVNYVASETAVKFGTDAVRQALERLRTINGLVTACLVEPDSAQVLEIVVGAEADAGPSGATGDPAVITVAAGASDVVQVIGLMIASLGEPDDLEDVTIALGRRYHLIVPQPTVGADGMLVVLTLDRARTNLALARQQLRALGPLLLGPEPEAGHDA
jgi:hypothetical protein